MRPHTADQIMTRNVITVKKGASVEEAMRLMAKHNISGLPVVDVDDKLVGIISEKDLLLRGMPVPSSGPAPLPFTEKLPDPVAEAAARASAVTVGEAMTRKVISFTEKSSVADIARAMVEHNINRVPIVRDGKVVGIISRGDVIRSMAALDFDEDDTPESQDRPRLTLL
ncbi:MAG: CBS domain-containing protein [Armatimonadota bacterium]